MNALIAWALAAAALFVGWRSYGLQGLALAGTLIVFWLLLHFNRVMRVMRNASHRPVGLVPSAVMLNARLHAGMTLMQVITLTRSLGQKVSDDPEAWAWADAEGHRVTLEFTRGKLREWALVRAARSLADGP